MKELTIEAKTENLDQVISFVTGLMEEYECPMKAMMQVELAVEEIFVNIAQYAYGQGTGTAEICFELIEDPRRIRITFMDSGVYYDPLAKEDPDITLSANEREVGGLGIFMIKKSMDDVLYTYRDGKNILTIIKNL